MRPFHILLTLTLLLAACTNAPSGPTTTGTTRVSGTVVDRLDGPPYSYLLVDTGAGHVWTAVPISTVGAGSKVTVVNGATLRNHEVRAVGRKLDAVVFGTLVRE